MVEEARALAWRLSASFGHGSDLSVLLGEQADWKRAIAAFAAGLADQDVAD